MGGAQPEQIPSLTLHSPRSKPKLRLPPHSTFFVCVVVLWHGVSTVATADSASAAVTDDSLAVTLDSVKETLSTVEQAILRKEQSLEELRERHRRSGSRSSVALDDLDGLERDLEDLRQGYGLARLRLDELSALVLERAKQRASDIESHIRHERELESRIALDEASLKETERKLRDVEARELRQVAEREELRQQLKNLKTTLHHVEGAVDDAALSKWIVKHLQALERVVVDSPEADEVLREYVSDFVAAESNLVQTVEQSLEHSLDRMITHSYSPIVAWSISYSVVIVPVALAFQWSRRFVTHLSSRQVVLLTHVFNLCLAALCLLLSALLRGRDPLHVVRAFSRRNLVFLQLLLAFQFPVCMVAMLVSIAKRSLSLRARTLFAFQAAGYAILAVDYRRTVWSPILDGREFPNQPFVVFLLYCIVIGTMLFLTVSSVDVEHDVSIGSMQRSDKSPVSRGSSNAATPRKCLSKAN